MIKENKQMQIGNSAGEYLAPRIKVVEIKEVEMKARRVVCQTSPVTTGISNMENEDGEW